MDKISEKDIEWLLKPNHEFDLKKDANQPKAETPSLKIRLLRICLWLLLIVALGILPFILLIKTSIYLNIEQGLNGWVSLLGGMGATIFVLALYVILLSRNVDNKKLLLKFAFGGVGVLVGGFCLYGLLYLSSVNAKSDSVQEVYRSLHPILRVAVATTTLAEGNLVITDIERTVEDYRKMGLSTNQSSLHFSQNDGFVHAIDLRTKGHTEFRNFLLNHSLRIMGFQTLRHIGTADHLHIALPTSQD